MTKPKLLVTNIITPMAALPSSQVKTKPKCNKNATATQAKKETTTVAYATTVLDTKPLDWQGGSVPI
ncbi:hypothetical protein BSPWISOXPB_1736 [uncultured Gammaproteobacteria bacterium]|nr:hypothetical protein BSPWISOXPB_1736 [uncultured Gammaproteobacteria bacterium]